MIDYRELQRTLFRMQLDPAFAAAVLADPAAVAPSLGPEERQILAGASLAAVVTDPRGRRRAQVVGNLASEFVLALAEAERLGAAGDILSEFPSTVAFHESIVAGQPLPLAFGAYLRAWAAESGFGALASLVRLDEAMAVARRKERAAPAAAPGELVLSPRVWLVSLPESSFEHALAVRAALDAGRGAPEPPELLEGLGAAWLGDATGSEPASLAFETVLLVAAGGPGGYRLREVAAERLEPGVASLLRAAERPLDAERLARLSAVRGWESGEVGGFIDELVVEGVLSRG